MTSRLDTIPADDDGVLVVGDCQVPLPGRDYPFGMEARFQRCPAEVGSLRRTLAAHRPRWIVIGRVDDDTAAQQLAMTAWERFPDLKLAMLGPLEDTRRCERWLRRGCQVYMADSSPFASVLAALDCASAVDVVIVDRAFHLQSLRSRQVGFVPALTARQREVLDLVGQNLTNSEIAGALHVSENTVEFHVRRLLARLGARNRMQAVGRASDLGLI